MKLSSNNVSLDNYPLESITYIKTSDNMKFVENAHSYLSNVKDMEASVFWNTSSYPFTLVCRGKNYSAIIDEARSFKSSMQDTISESSTMVCIGYKDGGLMQDEKSTILADINVKLRKFSAINTLKWNGTTLIKPGGFPLERLAWYDLCYIVKEPSLYDLATKLIDFKHRNIESVEHTSTLLLGNAGA